MSRVIGNSKLFLDHPANDWRGPYPRLKPIGGFCAESAGAITLFMVTFLGIPVSTTHTITGAIVGVGTTNRLSAVRWGIAGRIVWSWILTIPGSALISAATYMLASSLE